MKIAPLKVSDPWYGRITNDSQVQTDTLTDVPVENTVEMELVELLHGGPEDNYRPYLHLRGELTETRPAVELPYGVTELTMRRGSGLPVDAFYDFNARQLSDLVDKGYFTPAFAVPAEMSGIPWTLPGKADFLVVAPEFSDQPPLVFMSVHDQTGLELDEKNSGYELAAYFPDYSAEAEAQAVVEAAAAVAPPERIASSADMFADVLFDEHVPIADAPVRAATSDVRADLPMSVFERLVSEIESQHEVEPAVEPEVEPEPEVVETLSIAELYRSRVAPGVENVLAGEQPAEEAATAIEPEAEFDEFGTEIETERETPAESAFLDLGEPEPELTPLRLQGHEVAASERRTNRVRTELIEDEAPASDDEAQPGL